MRIRGVGNLCILFLCSAFSLAEQPTVKRDTQLPVQLRTAMATATAKPGAALEFQTTAGVLIGNGIVVPRGSRVLGTVEDVRSESSTAAAVLRVSLYRLEWDGGSTPLNAVVIGVEPSDVDDNPIWRHLHRAVKGRPTMLEHISVQSHIVPEPFVDFECDRGDFVLRRGVRLVLLQIDPQRAPAMFARSPILEVRSPAK
jgi:ribosomal protein L14